MYKIIAFLVFMNCGMVAQRLVHYDLYVKDTIVNYTGKTKKAISINGQIPSPTLYFTEGDTAEIFVHNYMKHATSIHWHGLILPNEQDGVPNLTTAPIKPNSIHIYKFPIKQSGTYWYHSHTMLQEQVGMYGAFIIHKKNETIINQEVFVLSDWSDENPHQIERSLHYATDWYAIKKKATQNYFEAVKKGFLKTKLTNELKRMHAMDVSDVYYERFLINGKTQQKLNNYKAGDQVRLRIVNGSSSTYFWLAYSGGKVTVVANDGIDTEPVVVDRLIIGVSETYDVLITIPNDSIAHNFIATSEDRIGSAVLEIGNGISEKFTPMPRLNYFEGMKMMNNMMGFSYNMMNMGMDMSLQQMDMNRVMYPEISRMTINKDKKNKHAHHLMNSKDIVTLNYAMLKSPVKTNLPEVPFRTLNFELTGNMNRYVWTINNKTVSENDKIFIKAGENVRIIINNNSMMRHPMHLHGHFFRVLNGQGEYSPLKNVLDILPMETDTIEFNASEEYGNWFFHCHILYHMMSGMGRVFSYENSPPNPQLPNPKKSLRKVYHDDKRFFLGAQVGLESNGSDGQISLMNTRWKLQTEWRLGLNDKTGYESESHIGRYIGKNQFAFVYSGWDWRYRKSSNNEKNVFGQSNTKDNRGVVCLGVQYLLPFLVVADLRYDHNNNLRLQITRDDIPLTSRLRLWGMFNTDLEYSAGIKYILTKYFSASSHYDSDMGIGVGVKITY
ncbi:MAG: multicopper oxidase domain-containing protein [Bacteroidota bacterium]|nr:multicopper oxidase domain-containing protein [Bacteroidota bacterium]MDP3146114.1 multicopper oxidase domain-containing protein [Bacteroidota bacterium]MDP3556728.1 multicopper oxidase domain-containing protein [Bacteroidota bacterium]